MSRLSKLPKLFFVALFSGLFLVSCMSPRKVLYLTDMKEDTQITLENKFEAKISPSDELMIWVTCYDTQLATPFNIGNSSSMSMRNSNDTYGYLVDIHGNIQFPVLGEIKAAGKTRLQLQEYIQNRLIKEGYLEDPMVTVRFKNFKIFFLGSDGGKAITVDNERCTFLEALALSGGLDVYTRRDRIGVMREVDGKMVMRYLDPRSSNVFNDPFFMLQQNDFIITEKIKSQYYKNEVSYWLSWISMITSLSSVITMVLLLNQQFGGN